MTISLLPSIVAAVAEILIAAYPLLKVLKVTFAINNQLPGVSAIELREYTVVATGNDVVKGVLVIRDPSCPVLAVGAEPNVHDFYPSSRNNYEKN